MADYATLTLRCPTCDHPRAKLVVMSDTIAIFECEQCQYQWPVEVAAVPRGRATETAVTCDAPDVATLRSLRRSMRDSTGGGRCCHARKVHGKHATLPRKVSDVEAPTVRFSAPSAECQADAQSASIDAALLGRCGQFRRVPSSWQAAAFILHFDEDAVRTPFYA